MFFFNLGLHLITIEMKEKYFQLKWPKYIKPVMDDKFLFVTERLSKDWKV